MRIILIVITLFIYGAGNITVSQNLEWVKNIGEGNSTNCKSSCVDSKGCIINTGSFNHEPDFAPGNKTKKLYGHSKASMFISKIDAKGQLVWARSIGTKDFDIGESVTTDKDDNIYVAGYISDTVNIMLTTGIKKLSPMSNNAGIVLKLSPEGDFIWAKLIPNDRFFTKAAHIVHSPDNSIYVIGAFRETVYFINDDTTFTRKCNGMGDYYICKMDLDGKFLWATSYYGPHAKHFRSAVTDQDGNLYLAGAYAGIMSTGNENLGGIGNMSSGFVSKINSSGKVQWTKAVGGTHWSESTAVCVDNEGYPYLAGSFGGKMIIGSGEDTTSYHSVPDASDLYIAKFDKEGNVLYLRQIKRTDANSLQMTPGTNNFIYSMTVDRSNNILFTGKFKGSMDFDPLTGEWIATSAGYSDIYVASMDQDGKLIWLNTYGNKMGKFEMPYTGSSSNSCFIGIDGTIHISGTLSSDYEFKIGDRTEAFDFHYGNAFLMKLKN